MPGKRPLFDSGIATREAGIPEKKNQDYEKYFDMGLGYP